MVKISISIVTYNSSNVIRDLLESLSFVQEIQDYSFDVFVIDNCSTDGTINYIKQSFPWVSVICNNKNLGYGRAHNIVISSLKSDFHLIINPDVIVEEEQLIGMIRYMTNNKDICLLSPQVRNADGSEQFLPKRKSSLFYCISGLYEEKCNIMYRIRSRYTLRDKKIENPIEVDFCSGCFMLFRTDSLIKSGGFDDRFFLYFEDGDLTLKMKKYGKTMYVPYFFIIHEWARDNRKSFASRKLFIKSMLMYLWKWKFYRSRISL